MNRDQTVALFLQGKEAWNAWAEKMLAERRAMEADGRWAAKYDFLDRALKAKNDETRIWMESAAADFSRCVFLVWGAEGPKQAAGDERREGGEDDAPVKSISIDGTLIDFGGLVFPGYANFYSAALSGETNFERSAFSGRAFFRSAVFTGPAYFRRAIFSAGANFQGVDFCDRVSFRNAAFFDDAYFRSAGFKFRASFRDCRFEKKAVFIDIATERVFDFIGVRSRRQVPDFLSAKFAAPPLLDNFRLGDEVEPGGFLRSVFLGAISWLRGGLDSALSAKYRRLKQLAIDSHDYRNEQIFFRGELRARRYLEDKPWHPAFWLGIIYEIISGLGFSVIRPAIAWACCIVIFAIYFLGQNEEMRLRRDPHFGSPFWVAKEYTRTAWKAFWSPPYCYPGSPPGTDSPAPREEGFSGLVEKARASTDLVNEAFSIAYHNAVIALDSSGDSTHRAFGCLYGVERYGDNPVAFVPRNVAIASGIQKLLSAVFILLFGLAVRNVLKVK
jgi:hypothetical protein